MIKICNFCQQTYNVQCTCSFHEPKQCKDNQVSEPLVINLSSTKFCSLFEWYIYKLHSLHKNVGWFSYHVITRKKYCHQHRLERVTTNHKMHLSHLKLIQLIYTSENEPNIVSYIVSWKFTVALKLLGINVMTMTILLYISTNKTDSHDITEIFL